MDTASAWFVLFEIGAVIGGNKTTHVKTVRCVRNATEPGMVFIPPGTFEMGDVFFAGARFSATLSAYFIDKYEVTVDQYATCVTAGICATPSTGTYYNWGVTGKEDHPVNGIDHADASNYCTYVSKRLPTEAEWEMAAKIKNGVEFSYPNGSNTINCTDAIMSEAGEGPIYGGCEQISTWTVGSKTQEINGTYDMAGNVYEWVSDWYDDYSSLDKTDPAGPTSGTYRVKRGGSWWTNTIYYFMGASRSLSYPSAKNFLTGFRCARSAP